jgi:hypothetical protein
MSSRRFRSVITVVAAAAGFASTTAVPARGGTVQGTVVNRSTGARNVSAPVSVIDPSAGMTPLYTVQATNGEFSIGDLDAGAYLARVDYEGVTYNWPFQIAENEQATIEITVYDTTSSWEGTRIAVPHFTATRHDDHLVIERVYDVYNERQPPRTIAGDGGYFRFPLPEQMHSFNGMYVQHDEVPVERQPVETDEAGVYRLDYPIRPGLTRVAMSYTVAYDSAAVSLNEKLLYDIESFTIFATDPDMQITSTTNDLIPEEGPHEGVSWHIDGLKKGEVLNLSFRGGSSQETASGGEGDIIVVPNQAEGLSLVLMLILLLALAAFTAIAAREPRMSGPESLRLAEYRNVLIRRLAKLDDLYETGAIPSAAYRAKRAELKNQVASLTYRLGAGSRAGAKTGGSKRSIAR